MCTVHDDMISLYEDDIFFRSVYLTSFEQKQKVVRADNDGLYESIIIYAFVLIWLGSVYFHSISFWRFVFLFNEIKRRKNLQFYLPIDFIGYEFSCQINSDDLFVCKVFTRFFTSISLFYIYTTQWCWFFPHSSISSKISMKIFAKKVKINAWPRRLELFFPLLLSLEHNAMVISSNISL